MEIKLIQSSHQNGISTIARARTRSPTTTIMRHNRTIVGTIHDSSSAGITPHILLVTFCAAMRIIRMVVSTIRKRVLPVNQKGLHRASIIVQLPRMQVVAWLVSSALVQLHSRSARAHVELAVAATRHVSCRQGVVVL